MRAVTLILALIVSTPFSIPPVPASEDDTAPSVKPRIESAMVWQEYQSALRDGDEERARACWTETARQYPVFDWHLYFDQAVAATRNGSLDIAEVNECGSFVELHITSPHWIHTAWSGAPRLTYYVVHAPKALLAARF